VIASLLSAGFILGKDAFEKAKDVDGINTLWSNSLQKNTKSLPL
jgi:hypothetical protein